jgi:23S rRNA (guanosine2251-2'-O)-methyltransferase
MFEIRQCTHPECGLRLPIDPAVHRGVYCPRCGAQMMGAAAPYQHRQSMAETRPKRRISILLDNLRSAYNTGAIFRTADGVGAAQLYLGGITPNPTENMAVGKTALGSELTIPWSAHPNACALAQELQAEGFRLLALETTPHAVPIFGVDLQRFGTDPLLLVVGNEQAGVDPGLLALCDLVLALPMAGSKGSLNVAVAFGVAAYWLAFS